MRNKIGHIIFLGILSTAVYAQKTLEKTWDAAGFDSVEIISDEIYHVWINSEPTETISVRLRAEGEYNEQVTLLTSEENRTLSLTHGFTPFFVKENDKLAAHKVISIEVEIRVPANLSVRVKGAIVSVETKGYFKNIALELAEGNCVLRKFKGNAQLQTKQGSIQVFAIETAAVEAISRTGLVKNDLPKQGAPFIKAESVNGDITLLKSQK